MGWAMRWMGLVVVLAACGARPPKWLDREEDLDHDGISSSSDACASDPEDLDGYEDHDGCPDPDDDGDHVPDRRDRCPREAEDHDGYDDRDGCPDPDNDGDHYADIDDACPEDREDFDGVADDDGCPETTPPPRPCVVSPAMLARVAFDRSRARVSRAMRPVIEQLEIAIAALPEGTRLAIVGGAVEGERNADTLGGLRARAVLEALVVRGVPTERLATFDAGTRFAAAEVWWLAIPAPTPDAEEPDLAPSIACEAQGTPYDAL